MAETSLIWRAATGADVQAIVALTQVYFEQEADQIFTTDPIIYAHNVVRAIVDQYYNPDSSLFWLALDADAQLLGYVWAERGQKAPWSADEMVAVKIVHVDMSLPARTRLRLCNQILQIVELWAAKIDVPIVCSTTMRGDQEAFLRLHERRGYDRRGSICYRRIRSLK